jgi:hypothetical protein
LCAQLLDELDRVHLISRYQVTGRDYLRIEQWYERARSAPKYPQPGTDLAGNADDLNSREQLQASESNCGPPRPRPRPRYTTTDAIASGARARDPPPRTRRIEIEAPTPEHHAFASEHGIDCQAEFLAYRDYGAAKGKRHVDEAAGFRNWLRNAVKFSNGKQRPNGNRSQLRAENMAILTGMATNERTISGNSDRVGAAPVLALPGGVRKPDVDGVG